MRDGMDIWGRCDSCDRWFYCPAGDGEAEQDWSCPVCGSAPVAIERRAPRLDTDDVDVA